VAEQKRSIKQQAAVSSSPASFTLTKKLELAQIQVKVAAITVFDHSTALAHPFRLK